MAVTQNKAVLPQNPFDRTAVCTAAEVAFQNPTQMVDLLLAADNVNGARLSKLFAIARAAVSGSAINCQLYKRVGSVYTLIDSTLIAVGTPSASVANQKADFGYSVDSPVELALNTGLAVAIGTATANGIVFRLEGAFY